MAEVEQGGHDILVWGPAAEGETMRNRTALAAAAPHPQSQRTQPMPMTDKTIQQSHCRHCGHPIKLATYSAMGGWEPDYDPANDPQVWRHLNGYAACLGASFAEPRPAIVVLCGSTRFPETFAAVSRRLGLAGVIVLSVSMFGHSGDLSEEECTIGHPTKDALDELHKRKIDLADRVLVLNVGGYIGDSTRSEIVYAEEHGKPIEYLEPADA